MSQTEVSNLENTPYKQIRDEGKQTRRKSMQKLKSLLDVLPRRKRIYHNAYYRMAHYVYPQGATEQIKVQHNQPQNYKDRIAYNAIRAIRRSYDWLTSYDKDNMTVDKWIQRCLILETLAGVPGMVGGMAIEYSKFLRSRKEIPRQRQRLKKIVNTSSDDTLNTLFISFTSYKI